MARPIASIDVQRDRTLVSVADLDLGNQIVAAFEGDMPELTPAKFQLLLARRKQSGAVLSDCEARAVLSADGGDDGHD